MLHASHVWSGKWVAGLVMGALVLVSPVGADFQPLNGVSLEDHIQYSSADDKGRYNYRVIFDEPGMLEVHRQQAPGEQFSRHDSRNIAHLEQLRIQQQSRIRNLTQAIGRAPDISHRFFVFESAIGVRMTHEEASRTANLPGVLAVERERVYHAESFRGPGFIGAESIWDGSALPAGVPGTRGEGRIIAVLDSGIEPMHPSFFDDPACGHGSSSPNKVISQVDCSSTDDGTLAGQCNGPFPEDRTGHGTHVAGIAAGNTLDGSEELPPDFPDGFDSISGVAPCASIRSYKVCPERACPGFDIRAGMSSVLLDGDADVVNFSISGGTSPWSDNDRDKLDLVDAGIVVVAAAGNLNPSMSSPHGRVGHLGPWVMSVAASTYDVDEEGAPAPGDVLADFSLRGPTPGLLSNLQKPDVTAPGVGMYSAITRHFLSVSGPESVPGQLENMVFYPGSHSPLGDPLVDAPLLRDSGQPGDSEGCESFPSNFFDSAVALVKFGGCDPVTKITNAAEAGAELVVIWNDSPWWPVVDTLGDEVGIPVGGLSRADSLALTDFMNANSGSSVTVDYAAESVPGYMPDSGTSMSSPLVAGAALLIRDVHPGWSANEVTSALRMTASRSGHKQDGQTPWDWDDVGSGRLDVTGAIQAGLVMDEATDRFLDANPFGIALVDLEDLNLPSVRDVHCTTSCSWTRTVRNTLAEPSSWSATAHAVSAGFDIDVSPATFSFSGNPDETREITITATPSEPLTSLVAFGEVLLNESDGKVPEQHLTVAIRGSNLNPPEISTDADAIDFSISQSHSETQSFSVANLGDETMWYALEQGSRDSFELTPGSRETMSGGPIELVLDDVSVGVVALGIGNEQFLWFNRFTPRTHELPFTLTTVEVGFHPSAPEPGGVVQVGDEFDVYVWGAPDGNPYGTVNLLASATGQAVSVVDGFNEIKIEEGVHVDESTGDLLIGVVNRTTRDEYFVIAGDFNATSRYRSWVAAGFPGGIVADPPDLAAAEELSLIDSYIPMNWLIRGYGVGGSPCLLPEEVPWLDVSPAFGYLEGNASQQVDVTVNATGLSPGLHEAMLCIESNDPQTEMVQIPVNVQVEEGDLPVAEISRSEFSFTLGDGAVGSSVLEISNIGLLPLNWQIEQAIPQAFRGNDDIVYFDDVNFRPEASMFGHGLQWHTGDTDFGGLPPSDMSVQPAPGGQMYFTWPRWLKSHAGGLVRPGETAYAVLERGDTVGPPVDQFWAASGLPASANWHQPLGVEGYLGFVFENPDQGGAINYGYARIVTENLAGFPLTIVGWAYNQAGDPITIPQEPGCENAHDISWLEVGPSGGSIQPGGSVEVTVQVDSSDLGPGTYAGILCLSTNDPDSMLVELPVTMTVHDEVPEHPVAVVTPASLELAVPENGGLIDLLTIANHGTQTLTWTADTAETSGCGDPVSIDWLNIDPGSDSVAPFDSQVVSVEVDATGLEVGDHEALLCIASNDPDSPITEVGVTLAVSEEGSSPDIIHVDRFEAE